jgi:CRP-like cAMP-binding protein
MVTSVIRAAARPDRGRGRAHAGSLVALRVAPGVLLYEAGEPADQLFVLRGGIAQVYVVSEDGRRVVAETVRAPSVLGEAALGEGQRHATAAQAVTACDVFVSERAAIPRLLQAEPELAVVLLGAVSARLINVAKRFEERAMRGAPARLARTLLQFAPAPDHTAHPITHAQIAEAAGTARETATRVLNQFAAAGMIALGRTRVRVLHPEALARIADTDAA